MVPPDALAVLALLGALVGLRPLHALVALLGLVGLLGLLGLVGLGLRRVRRDRYGGGRGARRDGLRTRGLGRSGVRSALAGLVNGPATAVGVGPVAVPAAVRHVLIGRGVRVRVLLGVGVLLERLLLRVATAVVLAVRPVGLGLRAVLRRGGVVGRRRVRRVGGVLVGIAVQEAHVQGVLVGVGVRVRVLHGLGVLLEPLPLG